MRWVVVLLALGAGCSPADDRDGSSSGATASGGGGDATTTGATGTSGSGGGGGSVAAGPTRYPYGPLHSPLTQAVLDGLVPVVRAANGRPGVFAKVGASNTVNTGFATCFAGSDVELGVYSSLEPSRAFFAETLVDASHTSYDRVTLAATVGWGADDVIAGDPSPLEQEVAAIDPAFAVIMLGTNDTYEQGVAPFDANLLRVVDALLDLGVVPWLTTIPPRGDTVTAGTLAVEINAVIRAIAQQRQVPLVDLHAALVGLPDYGLVSDGIHLQSYAQNGVHACWFDADALLEGMNQRNLLTLQALDRARRFVLEGEGAEPAPPPLAGAGTWEEPFVIDSLPFVDDRDTAIQGVSVSADYSCGARDEGGPEVVYRLVLGAAATIRARVFDADGVDVDLQLMSDAGPGGCIARADGVVEAPLEAGSYLISADSFVAGGVAQSGVYRLVVVALP
jgi:hypothetical protein